MPTGVARAGVFSYQEAIVDYHRFVGTRPDGGTCNLVATRAAREKPARGPAPPDNSPWTVTLEDGTPLVHVGKGVYRLDDMTIRSSDPLAP